MIELAGHPNRWKFAVEIDNTRGLNKKICTSFLRPSPVLLVFQDQEMGQYLVLRHLDPQSLQNSLQLTALCLAQNAFSV